MDDQGKSQVPCPISLDEDALIALIAALTVELAITEIEGLKSTFKGNAN
jgi:hypothetical protein